MQRGFFQGGDEPPKYEALVAESTSPAGHTYSAAAASPPAANQVAPAAAVPRPPPYDAAFAPLPPREGGGAASGESLAYAECEHGVVPLTGLCVDIEMVLSTVIVTLRGSFKALTTGSYRVRIPTRTTTTMTNFVGCVRRADGAQIYFETAVLANKATRDLVLEREAAHGATDVLNPLFFYFPLGTVDGGDTVEFSGTFLDESTFRDGSYCYRLPASDPAAFGGAGRMSRALFCSAYVSAVGGVAATCNSTSHGLSPSPTDVPNRRKFAVDCAASTGDKDIDLRMLVWQDRIAASLLADFNDTSSSEGVPFALFLSPPSTGVSPPTPRCIVFALDRSGSMGGRPMEQAKEALHISLSMLVRNVDHFAILAFDHECLAFREAPVLATSDNVAAADAWVAGLSARGGTDIPLLRALELALGRTTGGEVGGGVSLQGGMLPFVFLITDGRVGDERYLCRVLSEPGTLPKEEVARVRVMTMGIGQWCNRLFLIKLAELGRGQSRFAMHGDEVKGAVVALSELTAGPVLYDVEVTAPGNEPFRMIPERCPDLFVGCPIVLSGYVKTKERIHFLVAGTLGGTSPPEMISIPVSMEQAGHIPIQRILVKKELDTLVAEAWLTENRSTKKEAELMSEREGVPCALTSMVAYETTAERHGAVQQQLDEEPGAAGLHASTRRGRRPAQKSPGNRNALTTCAVAGVAGMVVVVSGAYMFGSMSKTLQNAGSLVNINDAIDVLGVLDIGQEMEEAGRTVRDFFSNNNTTLNDTGGNGCDCGDQHWDCCDCCDLDCGCADLFKDCTDCFKDTFKDFDLDCCDCNGCGGCDGCTCDGCAGGGC